MSKADRRSSAAELALSAHGTRYHPPMDASETPTSRGFATILASGLGGFALLLLLAMGSYTPEQVTGEGDRSRNLCGQVGAELAHLFIGSWGIAAFLIPLGCLGFAWSLWRRRDDINYWLRLTGLLLILPTAAGLAHLLPVSGWSGDLLLAWDQYQLHGLGGSTGHLLAGPEGGLLTRHLATTGSVIVLLVAGIACLALLQLRWRQAAARIGQTVDQVRRWTPPPLGPERAATPPPLKPASHRIDRPDPHRTVAEAPARDETTSSLRRVQERMTRDSTTNLDAGDLVARIRARREALERGASVAEDTDDDDRDRQIAAAEALEAEEAPSATSSHRSLPAVEADDGPTPAAPAITKATPRNSRPAKRPAPKRSLTDGDYDLPPVELLEEAPPSRDSEHEAETLETSQEIEDLFREFNINVKVVAATRGPTITMYELELQDAGMRVNKVAGFEKELSLRLGTDGIRIVAPLPNKKTIGIEVPNRLKVPVVMRDLVDEFDPHSMALPVIIGRDVIGRAMVGDLSKMPHLLIAGATGTGKSVCLNALIASILLYKTPREVRMVMIDPKMVELAGYEGIPQLLTPPITDMSKAHAALEWTCKTMDERFYALRMTGCRDIHAFNRLGPETVAKRLAQRGKQVEDIPGFPDHMPFLVVVVDEYADLMMVNKDVEKSLVRLTAKARACGIHVVLATQRPSADVVTGLIKSNLPTRVCCRVADRNNSRVVLDAGGAKNLLGRGDMLYLAPGTANLVRGQGVWVRDHEIDAIIAHACEQGEPEYDDSITAPGAISGAGGSSGDTKGDEWQRDYQFHTAVWHMFKSGRTGADFLRRRLQIGYNKATKYVEWLTDLGFLSEAKGSRPREFLRSWDDWLDELKANDVSWDPEDEAYSNPFA